jgi:uncharacterized Zn-binding protein involved in type VI secretion
MTYEKAARKFDPVEHTYAAEGGLMAGIAWAIVTEILPTKPSEIWKLIPVTKIFTVARLGWMGIKGLQGYNKIRKAQAFIHKRGGRVVDAAVGFGAEQAGEAIGSQFSYTTEGIKEGSPDVFTNIRPAARVDDPVVCDSSQIAQGSKLVSINKKPATRKGDKTKCNGYVIDGSSDVYIGGEPTESTEIKERSYFLPGLKGAVGGATKGVVRALNDGRIKKMSTLLKRMGKNAAQDASKGAKEGFRDDVVDEGIKSQTGFPIGSGFLF